ncbi:BTAD domain-containing putative transcriptional regulator [Longispora sp. K20-0274]|uniref:AfsR/SARP family transcriptional regulator n=1 Tax=Longispora sp. K20-0274 TaxID=3088255 RepID=UPI00399BF3CE
MTVGVAPVRRPRARVGATAVHLLGGPYVTHDGCRIRVPEGSKRLLAFIALRRGRVERCHAAGALWPYCDDRRAAGNLRSALWRLKAAAIDVFDCDKWSLALREDVPVDVHAIAEWANRLITNRPLPTDLAVGGRFEAALDLLPGCYDDWALAERERMRQRMLHALEALSRLLSGMGRHAEAVEAAMMAITSEPLRESAQRALFEAHIEEANWVEARRGFVAYRDLVRRELGVEPSRDLAVLVRLSDVAVRT